MLSVCIVHFIGWGTQLCSYFSMLNYSVTCQHCTWVVILGQWWFFFSLHLHCWNLYSSGVRFLWCGISFSMWTGQSRHVIGECSRREVGCRARQTHTLEVRGGSEAPKKIIFCKLSVFEKNTQEFSSDWIVYLCSCWLLYQFYNTYRYIFAVLILFISDTLLCSVLFLTASYRTHTLQHLAANFADFF